MLIEMNEKPLSTENTRMTFAGVAFKTTKKSMVRRPTYLKILRSGKVRVTCTGRYTDDYAWDAASNFGKGELSPEAVASLADEIERFPSGWWCGAWDGGKLRLSCHSFRGYDLEDLSGMEEKSA